MPTYAFRGPTTVAAWLHPGTAGMIAICGPFEDGEIEAIASAKLTGAGWVDLPRQAGLPDPQLGFVLNLVTAGGGWDLPYLVPRDPRLLAALRLARIAPERVVVALFADEDAMRETMTIAAASPSKGFEPVREASVWMGAAQVEDEIFS